MEILNVLGIDWKILVAQIIVFAALYFFLHKFGLQPILKFVQDRTKKIEEGVENAKKAQEAIEQAKIDQEQILADARKEAQEIIATARDAASKQAEAEKEKGKEELRSIAEKAKKQIQEERDKALRETREQAVELVLAATEKMLRDKVDADTNKAYIEKVFAEME